MTDQSHLPDDEIVSAHLDGEATPDEAARVTSDPEALARLATFGAIAARVAEPVRPDDVTRDAALAAALDVFDQQVAAASTGAAGAAGALGAPVAAAPDPEVVDLAARRSARSRRNLGLLSAAAAVVAVLLIGAAVLRGGRNDSQTTAANVAGAPNAPATAGAAAGKGEPSTTADRARPGAAESSVAPTESDSSGAASQAVAPTTAAAATPAPTSTAPGASTAPTNGFTGSDLGALAGPDDVRRAVAAALGGSDSSTAAPPTTRSAEKSADAASAASAIARCTAEIQAQDFELGTLVFSATATYGGSPALVLVYTIDRQQHPAANGGARIYTVDRGTCRVLDVQTV